MLESEFEAVSGHGTEGQGGRGFAGKHPSGSALVSFLFILETMFRAVGDREALLDRESISLV